MRSDYCVAGTQYLELVAEVASDVAGQVRLSLGEEFLRVWVAAERAAVRWLGRVCLERQGVTLARCGRREAVDAFALFVEGA